AAAVLDERDLRVREAPERSMADERRNRVLDRSVVEQLRLLERLRATEVRHLAGLALPLVVVPVVAGIGHVEDDERPALLDQAPERIELLEAERARAVVAPRRRRAHQHRLGAALEHPLEL